MADHVPYYSHCGKYGAAYPWRAAALTRANQPLDELEEVEKWSDAVKERARELLGDIVNDNVSVENVETATKWIEQRRGTGAGKLFLWAAKALGGAALSRIVLGP
jgi:hypothetical protein